jgi:ATP synthase protein I
MAATNPQPPPSRKNRLNNYARYSGLGIQMVVLIAAGMYGGYKLDKWLHLKFPAFTILLSLAGTAGAIWYAIKDFKKK